MKKILFLLLITSTFFVCCSDNKKLLVDKEWILFSETSSKRTIRYTADQHPMTFRFNSNGTFFYSEKGIPKGEETLNTWELSGKKIKLHWYGVWVDQLNELVIDRLEKEWLTLKNENSNDFLKPSFIFYPKGHALENLRGNINQ